MARPRKTRAEHDQMVTMNVKLPLSQRQQFVEICADLDTSASREIRKMIRSVIDKHSQGKLNLG